MTAGKGTSTLYPHMAPLTEDQWTMVAANLGLVGFTLNRFAAGLVDDRYSNDDAWQNGYLGLCKAVTKFDPAKAKFSTYAVVWIRQAITRGKYLSLGASDQRPFPVAPLSLDKATTSGTGDELGTVGDLFASDDDVEASATATVGLADLLAMAGTDLERAILDRHLTGTSLEAVGRRFGISAEAVRKHQVQLHRRMRVALECAA